MKRIIFSIFFAFSAIHSAHSAEVITVEAFTAALPPFTIDAQKEKPGFLHELVTEMAKRADVKLKISYFPWKRAQQLAEETPNSLLFGVTRTKDREATYSWVSNLVEPDLVFATTSKPINSYDEAKTLGSVGVLAGTPREKILKEKNFANIQVVNEVELNAKKLDAGRVETWFELSHRVAWAWIEAGLPIEKLVIGQSQEKTQTWLVGNKVLPDGLKERMEKALADIKADGTYDTIFKKYFGNAKL